MTGSSVDAIRLPNTSACCPQVGATRNNPLLGTRAFARGYAKESRTNSCGSLRVYSLSSPIYIPQISFQIIFLLSLRSIYLGRKKNLFYQLLTAKTICALWSQHLIIDASHSLCKWFIRSLIDSDLM